MNQASRKAARITATRDMAGSLASIKIESSGDVALRARSMAIMEGNTGENWAKSRAEWPE